MPIEEARDQGLERALRQQTLRDGLRSLAGSVRAGILRRLCGAWPRRRSLSGGWLTPRQTTDGPAELGSMGSRRAADGGALGPSPWQRGPHPSRHGRLPLRSRRPACAAPATSWRRQRHHRRRVDPANAGVSAAHRYRVVWTPGRPVETDIDRVASFQVHAELVRPGPFRPGERVLFGVDAAPVPFTGGQPIT